MKPIAFAAFLLVTSFAFAQSDAENSPFKAAFLKAVRSKDATELMALTCVDGISPEWRTMLESSNLALIQQFQSKTPSSIEFFSFTGPQPDPIKYKDTELVPNLPITTIMKITWEQDQHSTASPTSTDIRLGVKDGTLLVVALVPKGK